MSEDLLIEKKKEEVATFPNAPDEILAVDTVDWENLEKSYRVEVILCLGEVEGEEIPVFVPRLPGAVSYGKDEQEALSNIEEALTALIEEYLESDGEIPWKPAGEVYDLKGGEVMKTVLVNVA